MDESQELRKKIIIKQKNKYKTKQNKTNQIKSNQNKMIKLTS